MRIAASIILGDRAWLWPAATALAVAAVIVLLAYARVGWPLARRIAAAALKVTGFALVLMCLTEPLWSGTRAKPGENLFLLLADNSSSLQIADRGGGPSRGEQLRQLLARQQTANWQTDLEREFDVRRYTFGTRLESVEHFDALAFDRPGSRLHAAATMLRDRYRDRPVAGILLFTDGNLTDRAAAPFADTGLPPVYPVVWSEPATQLDVAIAELTVTQAPFEDAPLTVQAGVHVAGGPEAPVVIGQLLREDGTLIQEISGTANEAGLTIPLKFEIRPTAALEFYQVRAALDGQTAQFDDPSASRESVLANNSRLVTVEHDAEPHRILYVAGRPNWEFKFLRRSVESDPALQLVGLVRIAKKEAKFEFRGRAGERGNALFQGFDADRETDTESYDEPVIVRLGTRDDAELRSGFPTTREELFEYRAVILDDVEAQFFTHDQLALLEQYVSDRGGSLLMLGGPDTFAHGGYARTVIEDMLPIYLERRPDDSPPSGEYRWKLTRDGWLQPWTRLRRTESDEQQRIAEMPAFRTLTPAANVKPAARTLAEVRDTVGNDHPALVAQQYGAGRVAALLIGDAWRWPLQRTQDQADDYAKAWRQMLRWLVVDVPARIDVAAERESESATTVRLVARVRDAAFEPVDTAAVAFTVRTPSGAEYRLDGEPSLDEPGMYAADYAPHESGGFRATALIRDQQGTEIGRAETGWTSDPAAEEFRRIDVNRKALESLAAATRGEIVRADDLAEFVQSLPTREAPVMEAWNRPLWHNPWMLLAAIGCFAGEWGLRRLWGLP